MPSTGLPVTLRVEELIAEIIRQELPDIADTVIEGSSQAECPHPVYISVQVPDESANAILPTGPIYNVMVDVIRMAYYKAAEDHEARKQAVGAIHRIFKTTPDSYLPALPDTPVAGLYLKGWVIESIGQDDVGDYVGDGMRLMCAVLEEE